MNRMEESMKKILIFISVFFLLVGCNSKDNTKEKINFEKTESQEEEHYEYEHGVANYHFEQWNYNGETLSFDYNINNIGKECEFGLMFLIDGIPQEYEVDGEMTSMYILDMETNKNKTLSIKMNPKIDTEKDKCNFNAFLILNPSLHIEDIKQYGHNHSISSVGTILLEMNKTSINKNIKLENTEVHYQDIPKQVIKDNTKDGMNMLDSNIYIAKNSSEDNQNYLYINEPLQLKIYGKKGNYRILEFKNNQISNMYNITVKKDQYSNITLNPVMKKNDNIYFLVVPLDAQDPYDYIMINQSERWIVK